MNETKEEDKYICWLKKEGRLKERKEEGRFVNRLSEREEGMGKGRKIRQ